MAKARVIHYNTRCMVWYGMGVHYMGYKRGSRFIRFNTRLNRLFIKRSYFAREKRKYAYARGHFLSALGFITFDNGSRARAHSRHDYALSSVILTQLYTIRARGTVRSISDSAKRMRGLIDSASIAAKNYSVVRRSITLPSSPRLALFGRTRAAIFFSSSSLPH